MAGPAALARAYLLDTHRGDLAVVLDCADTVAASWDGGSTADRAEVVPAMRSALDRAGLLDSFPAMLRGAVAATGRELQGRPVAAPPYVAVTAVGPVLRATTDDGRLVVTVEAFAVERDPVRYVRTDDEPAAVLSVEWTQ